MNRLQDQYLKKKITRVTNNYLFIFKANKLFQKECFNLPTPIKNHKHVLIFFLIFEHLSKI